MPIGARLSPQSPPLRIRPHISRRRSSTGIGLWRKRSHTNNFRMFVVRALGKLEKHYVQNLEKALLVNIS